uniref:Uncharacterized protein n=1 Tax=Oryza glumipatula TaxID=40148 RepID=A0A0D9YQA4_9ORYZ
MNLKGLQVFVFSELPLPASARAESFASCPDATSFTWSTAAGRAHSISMVRVGEGAGSATSSNRTVLPRLLMPRPLRGAQQLPGLTPSPWYGWGRVLAATAAQASIGPSPQEYGGYTYFVLQDPEIGGHMQSLSLHLLHFNEASVLSFGGLYQKNGGGASTPRLL